MSSSYSYSNVSTDDSGTTFTRSDETGHIDSVNGRKVEFYASTQGLSSDGDCVFHDRDAPQGELTVTGASMYSQSLVIHATDEEGTVWDYKYTKEGK